MAAGLLEAERSRCPALQRAPSGRSQRRYSVCRSAVAVPSIAALPGVARGWALCTPRKGQVLLLPFAISLFRSERELCRCYGYCLSVSTDLEAWHGDVSERTADTAVRAQPRARGKEQY